MTPHAERPLKRLQRLLAELFVVFLGVVIALAADSWRESLVERRTEADYLLSLRTDLVRSDSALISAIASTQQEIEEMDAFLDLVLSETPLPDTLRTIGLPFTPAASLPTGTLDALIDGGQIHFINDARLRAAIITYRSEIEDLLRVRDDLTAEAGTNAREWVVTNSVLRNEGGYPVGYLPAGVVRTSAVFQGQYRFQRVSLGNNLRVLERMRGVVRSLSDELAGVE